MRHVPQADQPKEDSWRYHWTTTCTLALDTSPGRHSRLRRAEELERGGFA